MTDMLAKLYDIQDDWSHGRRQAAQGVTLRKPIGPERRLVVEWVSTTFGPSWASETEAAFSNRPVSCFVALHDQSLIGFACYDATALGFFGPGGVAESYRAKGIGTALLLSCLLDMRLKGYGYAIIGDVGPVEFYRKVVGAIEIPDSTPGFYKGLMQTESF
jgi:GNAT superfamily N-acetyltransferase